MNISEEAKIILDAHMVSHGRLALNPQSRSKHHAVTDYEKVYVKVLKPGTMSHAKMLKAELDFACNTEYGTKPLIAKALHKNSRDHHFIMSAWEFEKQIPITYYSLNPVQLAMAANELYKIHSFEPYETLRTDSYDEYHEYATCLSSASFNFLSSAHQSKIKKLYQDIIQPGTDALSNNPRINVVSHGEATLEKITLKPSSVQWVDYESVRSAPREYDLSRMFLQLHHRMKRPDLWDIFRGQYELKLGRPLNDERLEQFALLHLTRKSLILASQTLHSMNEDRLLTYLQEVTKIVNGKIELRDMSFSAVS